jgi:hypothetical protein
MAWKLEGSYFENCPCDVPCPCTVSLDLGADTERCDPALIFHVESGDIEGVDVGGLSVIAIGDAPRVMIEGGWRLGVIIDDKASDEQAEKLGAVFSGALGGPMEALAGLIGENLGVERMPIEFSSSNGRHSVRAGDAVEIEVQDVVPFGIESGEPARLEGIFHPASTAMTIAKATKSKIKVFGIDKSHEGKSAFSTHFAWSG